MSRPKTGGQIPVPDNSMTRSNGAIEFGLSKENMRSNERTEEFILE